MIARILILLIALLTLPAWGINRLVLRNKWPRWARLIFAFPHLLLLLALTFMAINESYTMTALPCCARNAHRLIVAHWAHGEEAEALST